MEINVFKWATLKIHLELLSEMLRREKLVLLAMICWMCLHCLFPMDESLLDLHC